MPLSEEGIKMTRGKTMTSKIPVRVPIYFSALMALALMLGAGGSAQAKFNPSNVGPDYGCLLNSVGNELAQLMQLHTDKKGKVESGSLSFNLDGEVCKFTLASGSYTISKTTGTGTLTLTWTFSSGSDGDEAFCTSEFGPSITEHLAFVLEASGKLLDIAMLDPGITGGTFTASGDEDDFFKFGSCTKQ
jgi:hypothetical protein